MSSGRVLHTFSNMSSRRCWSPRPPMDGAAAWDGRVAPVRDAAVVSHGSPLGPEHEDVAGRLVGVPLSTLRCGWCRRSLLPVAQARKELSDSHVEAIFRLQALVSTYVDYDPCGRHTRWSKSRSK